MADFKNNQDVFTSKPNRGCLYKCLIIFLIVAIISILSPIILPLLASLALVLIEF